MASSLQQCILWETTNVNKLEQYAVHAQKILREKEQKNNKKKTMIYTQPHSLCSKVRLQAVGEAEEMVEDVGEDEETVDLAEDILNREIEAVIGVAAKNILSKIAHTLPSQPHRSLSQAD